MRVFAGAMLTDRPFGIGLISPEEGLIEATKRMKRKYSSVECIDYKVSQMPDSMIDVIHIEFECN